MPIRLTLVAVVMAMLAAACTSGDSEPTTAPSTSAVTSVTSTSAVPLPDAADGGIARVGLLEAPLTVNPVAEGGTQPVSALVQHAALPGAFVFDADSWRAVPDLAVRVPTVEAGDVVLERGRQTVTWTIDPDASWSDGTPVSGADFAFTLRATLGLTECGGQLGRESVFGFEIGEVGAKSITVEIPGPTTDYESMFPYVLPAHATDGEAVCTATGVGWPTAGPFQVAALDATTVTLARNDDYWRGAPSLAGVEFVAYADESSLIAAYQSGDVDLVVTIDEELAGSLAAADADAAITVDAGNRIEHLVFDFAIGSDEESLLRSRTFRQAIARAIDRAAMASATGWPARQGVVRSADPADPWSGYGYDVDEATRLLASVCEENGRDCATEPPRLRLVVSDFGVRPALVERVSADLEAIGIDVTVDVLTSREASEAFDAGRWDLAIVAMGESPGVGNAASSLVATFDPDGLHDISSYGADLSIVATERAPFQFNVFIGQLAVSPDLDRVARLLGELQTLLATDMVLVPLVGRPVFTVVSDRLDGVVANATPSGVTWNIASWSYQDE